jgi:hypothetical protein
LILQTRHGGLNNGSHWFALTWLPITNFVDLNISQRDYHPGQYLLSPSPKRMKEKKGCTPHVRAKAATRTPHVREEERARTPHVREKALLSDSARTPHVHNEYIPIPIPENIDPWLAGNDSAVSQESISGDENKRRVA